ncbi:hypothetical protein LTR70_000693 [Exophiala xenobiotica]|uniref:Uncharacterized protein n=1 Tax=Lithohypha guttulata TaxID=1690604 RepID=A0ABR0KNJ8_9EURO|nr:hypothetical protein LTR24_000636 [Lithohypha guttulata]KAK5329196.1 hypothetical protein LTR70_000693 [Exophiala xenobiotica]
MSIWPKRSKGGKPGSQTFKSSTSAQRPKLYVLAIQPVIPTTSQPTEWSLELSVPQTQQSNLPSAPTSRGPSPQRRYKHGSFLPLSHKHKGHSPIPTSLAADDSFSVQRPQNIVLKIFLCSVRAGSATTSTDSTPLTTHIIDALSPIQSTPDSTSWIRQVLFALQIGGLIPGVSQGFVVDKFMAFATSYLDQHQHQRQRQHAEASRGNEYPLEAVHTANYSKTVRENERLRSMLSSDTTDYAVINAAVGGRSRGPETPGDEHKHEDEDEDEDCWMWHSSQAVNGSANAQTQSNREKKWGRFWVTYGSGAAPGARGASRSEREPWEKRDPYAGLM